MKTLFGIAAIVLMATPAQASGLNTAMGKFCAAVQKMNNMGVSAAPGTQIAAAAQKVAGQTTQDYRMVWDMAKSSKCSRIY